MACGTKYQWGPHLCELAKSHPGYHEQRLPTETVRWASDEGRCEDPSPGFSGWKCSLTKGHLGNHEGWPSHLITSGQKAPVQWAQVKAPRASPRAIEIDEYDLLPDATPDEVRTLPDINSKKAG